MAKLNFWGGKFQGFDDGGALEPGGTLDFYEPGTTTRKDTYTLSDLQTANANPVVLDSAGRASIWLKNEDYKVVYKDADGNTLYTADNINPATTSSTSNFSLQDNSSFEDGVDSNGHPLNWVTTEWGTVSIDTSDNGHSASSLKCVSTGAGGGWVQSESFIECDEYRKYSLHWLMKSSVADVRNLVQIKWYTSAQASISTEILFDESTSNPTSWEYREFEANPPATARYCKLEFYGCHSSDATPGTTWYDGILFQRKFAVPENLNVVMFDDGATVGPNINLLRDSVSPADSDVLGKIVYQGKDDGDNTTTYAGIRAVAVDVTNTTEDGRLVISTMQAGTETDVVTLEQGVQVGSPTSGDQGVGTINATAIYDDGEKLVGRIFLESQTASSSSSLDFTAGTYSDFSEVIFVLNSIQHSTASSLNIRTSTDGGSTYDSGASDYEYQHTDVDTVGTEAHGGSAASSGIQTGGNNVEGSSSYGVNGIVRLLDPGSTQYTSINWEISYNNSSGIFQRATGTGVRVANADVDAIQFFPSSGNLASGTIYVYGIKKS